jgi:hypothetical protein
LFSILSPEYTQAYPCYSQDVFVPIPVFKEVDNGDRAPSQFDRPKQYIKEPKPATPDFYGVIEYDLDDDDADFIEGLNDVIASSKKKRKRISEGDFEAYMDFFEKEHFFKVCITNPISRESSKLLLSLNNPFLFVARAAEEPCGTSSYFSKRTPPC